MSKTHVPGYSSPADTPRTAPLRGKGNDDVESTSGAGCAVHAGGQRDGEWGGGQGDGRGIEVGHRAGAVGEELLPPLTALAVLFEVCKEGPPDDSPAYADLMHRAAQVLKGAT